MSVHRFGPISRFVACLSLASASMVLSVPVAAAPLVFNFSGNVVGGFTLDSNPTPVSQGINSFTVNISNGTGNFSGATLGVFPDNTAGLSLLVPGFNLQLHGQQLFTNTLSNPVFSPGTYSLQLSGVLPASLTIAPGAPAPELGTGWWAAIAAAAALALTRLRRRPAIG